MAHDGSDGSQYDIKGPWDQDRLMLDLERHLALAETATTPEEQSSHREAAQALNEDIRKLHGIDLLGNT